MKDRNSVVEALTRVLAADAWLVAESGEPSTTVTRSFRLIQIDVESAHARAQPIVVVELHGSVSYVARSANVSVETTDIGRPESMTQHVPRFIRFGS